MGRKINDVFSDRKRGKDKARMHYERVGKYGAGGTRRKLLTQFATRSLGAGEGETKKQKKKKK